jgi:hypothetical protein
MIPLVGFGSTNSAGDRPMSRSLLTLHVTEIVGPHVKYVYIYMYMSIFIYVYVI